jgi:hypothetical protein
VAGIYHYMAKGRDPLLMDGDDGRSARALSVAPAPVDEWVARRPWQIWASDPEERGAQTLT